MTGMTPERLLEIGNRLPREVRPGTVERDILELLTEVVRLRAGIASLEESLRHDMDGQHWHSPYEMGCKMCAAEVLRRLLDPTEGETDEQPCCRYCGEPGSDCPGPCC